MTFALQKVLLGSFAGIIILLSSINIASAQISINVKNPNPYTGNQSWFMYEKKAGQVIEDIATIKNFGKETETVKVYAVDATSNADGNFILTFSDQKQQGVGTWTEIKEKEIILKPGERIDVPFTINLPANIAPSEYVGGIIAESGTHNKDCKENICTSSISVKTRVGSRIYITVPGIVKDTIAWTDFHIEQKSSGKTTFHFKIENKGNVTYKPKATIEIIDIAGNTFDTIQKTLGESLPNTTITSSVIWNKKELPLMGQFTVRAKVDFIKSFKNDTELHSAPNEIKKLQFWIMPWKLIELSLLLMASFTVSLMISKRNFKKMIAHCSEYEVQEYENISSIANSHGMRWEKLAKINKLSPPYILTKGQKILVPNTNKSEKHEKN